MSNVLLNLSLFDWQLYFEHCIERANLFRMNTLTPPSL